MSSSGTETDGVTLSDGGGVVIDGGSSLNTNPPGIPQIPSTILTVNQVG